MVDKLDLYDLRRREVQALGAALSCRNWHMMETAYNSLRDKLDRAGFTVAGPRPDAATPANGKQVERARPFREWHEDHGDVLWWKLPIMESPYCGSPLDLGRGMKVTVQIGFEEHEMPIAHTGGWPFSEDDEPDLWWTPLPSPTFFRTALGNKETDR